LLIRGELIDGERTVEEIVQETGLTQDYLVEILLFFEEEGIIKLDWGEDSASQELYSGPPLDTAVVISALRSLCNHLVSVHGEWERIAAIIEELLRWETDYYYLEQDVLMLSVAYVMMSEPRRADSILSQALVHIYDPEDVLYSNRAWARLLIDNYQGAEEDFYRALEDLKETEKYYGLYPEDEHRRTSSKVGLALALLKQDRRSEAEAVFREVLAEEPRWQEGPVEYPEAFYSSEESHLMRLAYQEFVSKNSE